MFARALLIVMLFLGSISAACARQPTQQAQRDSMDVPLESPEPTSAVTPLPTETLTTVPGPSATVTVDPTSTPIPIVPPAQLPTNVPSATPSLGERFNIDVEDSTLEVGLFGFTGLRPNEEKLKQYAILMNLSFNENKIETGDYRIVPVNELPGYPRSPQLISIYLNDEKIGTQPLKVGSISVATLEEYQQNAKLLGTIERLNDNGVVVHEGDGYLVTAFGVEDGSIHIIVYSSAVNVYKEAFTLMNVRNEDGTINAEQAEINARLANSMLLKLILHIRGDLGTFCFRPVFDACGHMSVNVEEGKLTTGYFDDGLPTGYESLDDTFDFFEPIR